MSIPTLDVKPEPIRLEREALRVVVYGDTGVGKTTLAMTFPNPLVIDTDGGLISVAYLGGVTGERWEPTGHQSLSALLKWVYDNADRYDSIVVDDLPGLCEILMMELIEEHAKVGSQAKRPLLQAAIPEQAEYLANQQQVKRILHVLRQLNKHVCIVSSARTVKVPPSEEPTKRTLDLAVSARTPALKWAHVVGEMWAGVDIGDGEGETHRVLFTEPTPTRDAKSRFAEHRPYVVDPTFERLWAPIQKKFTNGE